MTSPFNCFVGPTCFSVTTFDDPGDTIFLFNGAYTAGYSFLANQKLIGQGAGATLDALAGVTVPTGSDALPVTNGNPDNVTIDDRRSSDQRALNVNSGGIVLRGFAIGNTTGTKIFGNNFGTLTAGNTATPDVRLTGTGQALNLTTGAFAATSAFTSVASTSSTAQGINLAGITGTVAFNGTQVSSSTTQGILIGTTTADINFGNTTVTAGTDAVSFQNNSGGTRTFGALTATAGGVGTAFLHGAGGGNVTINNLATLTSGAGNTIDIQTSTAATTVNFAGGATLTKTAGGGTGVNLLNDNGNVTFGGTLTIGTSGARFPSSAVTINGGTGTYSLGNVSIFTNGFAGITATNADGTLNVTSGTVDVNAATALNIDGPAGITTLGMTLTTVNSTGGTNNVNLADVSGSLTIQGGALSGAAGAAFAATNTAATVTCAASITSTTGGISLTTNTGGTFTFSGGLNLSTGTNPAFTAIGGGTVNVCDENPCVPAATGALVNTLTTTTGTALRVTSTTIGANKLEFKSIAANGAANGIFLQNTGANGGLIVSGDGTNTTKGGNATGGTIQNINGADGSTAGIGVYLNNTSNVVLRRMTINGTIQNMGLYGELVNNLTLQYCTIGGTIGTSSGSNDLNLEAPMAFGKTFPSIANGFAAGSVSTVNNCLISGGIQHNVEVYQFANTASLTISNSNITNNGAALGSDGINIETHTDSNGGTPFAQLTVSVQTCVFDNNKSQALQANALGDSFLNLTINNSTVQKTAQGNEGFVLQNGGDADMTVHVTNNTFTGILGTNILVGQVVNNASNLSNLIGVIQGNAMTVGNATTFPTNRTLIVFFSSTVGLVSTANVLVDANSINTFSDPVSGIAEPLFVSTPDANTDPAFTATVTNNVVNINDPNGTALRGIAIQSTQNVSAGCIDVRGNDVNYTPVAPAGVNGIRVRQVAPATLQMERGNALISATAAAALATNNPSSTTEVLGTVTVVENNICQTAPTIALPLNAKGLTSEIPNGAPVEQPAQVADNTKQPVATSTDMAPVSAPAVPPINSQWLNGNVSQIQTGAAATRTQDASQIKTLKPGKGDKGIVPQVANFPLTFGTLAAGKTVTVTFSVTVNSNIAVSTVSNQGSVSGSNFPTVTTTDPGPPVVNGPTVTQIALTNITARDAKAPEPPAGSVPMLFTVTLSSPAGAGGLMVNYATADGGATPATGGATCGGTVDYETTSGTLSFAAGQSVKTVAVNICADTAAPESDETLLLNLSGATSGTITDAQAVGTITQANAPGTFVISEVRTSGPGGLGDDFVELYNNINSPLTVAASDASAGYGVFKMGTDCNATPVLIGTIPNGTIIPARGHYLFVGSQYSLGTYATGNLTLTTDIESDANVAVFTTADVVNLSTTTRLDAVGFDGNTSGGVCDLLREGTTLQPAGGSTSQYSFVRSLTTGLPKDTNDNAADFVVVSTTSSTAVGSNLTPLLGAPGPENLTSPIQRNATVKASLIDTAQVSTAAPNRVRDFTSYPDTLTPSAPNGGPPASNPYSNGTLTIRRKFTNNTGAAVTRLRFRIVDITTINAPPGGAGQADLRVLTSSTQTVTITGGGSVNVQGITLELSPQAKGGGFNSSVAAGTITTGTPLANGASINVNFLLGVVSPGTFRFFINVEALP